jgi:hypothetical protein
MFAIIKMILAALLAALSWVATAKRSDVEDPPAKKETDDDTDPFELQLKQLRERKSFEEQIRKATAHIKPPQEPDDNEPFERQRERSRERSSGLDHEPDGGYLDDKRNKEKKRSKEVSDLHARLSMEQAIRAEQLKVEAAKKAKDKEAEKAKKRAKAERARENRVVAEQRRGRDTQPDRHHDSPLARWYDTQMQRCPERDQPPKQEPKQEQSRQEQFMEEMRKVTRDIKAPDRSEDRDRDRDGGRGR